MTHNELMSGYYSAREEQEQRAEDYSYGYTTERETFYREVETKITFKDYLRQGRRG